VALVMMGAVAGVLLVLLVGEWFLVEPARRRAGSVYAYTPADLLVSIRLEILADLVRIFWPGRLLSAERGRERSRLERWLRRRGRRWRRLQYRVIMRMRREEVAGYLRLGPREVARIAERAHVAVEDVRAAVIDVCAQVDAVLRRLRRKAPLPQVGR